MLRIDEAWLNPVAESLPPFAVLDLESGAEGSFPGAPTYMDTSPDGTRILSHVQVELDGRDERRELWLFDTTIMQARQLGSPEVDWLWGAFSSDGSRVVYSEIIFSDDGDDWSAQLYVADADGSNPRLIMQNAVPVTLVPDY